MYKHVDIEVENKEKKMLICDTNDYPADFADTVHSFTGLAASESF